MSLTRTIQISQVGGDQALRAGEFLLTADVPELPLIVSQPEKNFKQLTWLEGIQVGIPIFQYIKIEDSKVSMLEGTEFLLGIESVDLSNKININDTTNLSYVWTRDESPIYELNNMAGGIGTNAFLVPRASSSANLSGRYVCEVSNAYGSVTSNPIDIEIINPLEHPKLLKNLILNGNADGGLSGWVSDTVVITKPFVRNEGLINNFGSFRLNGWSHIYAWDKYGRLVGNDLIKNYPLEFFFSTGTDANAFYRYYKKRLDAEPDFNNPNVQNYGSTGVGLQDNDKDSMDYNLPQIVPNEDYTDSHANEYAGFFPGISWMDRYNQNENINTTANLANEYKDFKPHYFTREKINFEKFGGQQEAKMSQTVDLSQIANLVDGKTYGIKYITSQFFAYVGAGITGYKITLQTLGGTKSFNFYMKELEKYYNTMRIASGWSTPASPNDNQEQFTFTAADFANYGVRYELVANSPIDIEPLVEDRTNVMLEYLDESETVLKTENIKGPDNKDVWAIKEKVYFPLIWYGIYSCVRRYDNQTNPIRVFGQTYTTLQALRGLMAGNMYADVPPYDTNNSALLFEYITDINAKFLLNKYDFQRYNERHLYPRRINFGTTGNRPWNDNIPKSLVFKSLQEYGAAAMFGVGRNIQIPARTRSVKITVTFKNTTPSFKDTSPETKGWLEQEIYADYFADGNSIGIKDCLYGYPRCGITSMKFLLFPNDFKISSSYLSYDLPPAEYTVLGLQRQRYEVPNAFNTANGSQFTYTLIKPTNLPSVQTVPDPYVVAQGFFNLIQGINNAAFNDIAVSQSIPPTFNNDDTSGYFDGSGDSDIP